LICGCQLRTWDTGLGNRDTGTGTRGQGLGTRAQEYGTRDMGQGTGDRGHGYATWNMGHGIQEHGICDTSHEPRDTGIRNTRHETRDTEHGTEDDLMYNLLFVDDDILIADSLQYILDWERVSLNAPYITYSYDQARQIFTHTPIHIIISDIEMRGHSGLDLMEWTKRNHPQTLRGFLTCHARFEYAQRAIKLGAFGYLLKPIDEAELEEFLSECVGLLDHKGESDVVYEKTGWSRLVRMAVSYIRQNLSNPITREIISRELHVSESSLSRIFSREIGMPITEYITDCRIKQAMRLLTNSDDSITEICAKVGYNYPAYFTKIFREKTGKSPHQYRIATK